MPDQPITWQMLTLVLGGIASIAAGAWALLGAMKKEFENTRKESNAGRQRLYDRVDDFGREIRETYTPRDLFHSELRRVGDALEERDRQIFDLSARVNAGPCPLGPQQSRGAS